MKAQEKLYLEWLLVKWSLGFFAKKTAKALQEANEAAKKASESFIAFGEAMKKRK